MTCLKTAAKETSCSTVQGEMLAKINTVSERIETKLSRLGLQYGYA